MAKIHAMWGVLGIALVVIGSCGTPEKLTLSGLNPACFDSIIDGKPTALYTLRNAAGMEVCLTNFGGRVVSIMVPDRNGKGTDVVLGYDNVAQYADTLRSPSDFGASVGRYANRIQNGRMTIEGVEVQLPRNNFGHCLHGGPTGWQYRVYDAVQRGDSAVCFTLVSPDGDNGFPGTVNVSATYTLLSDNTLDVVFEATTDKTTVVNMTNHSYFNLNGDPAHIGTDMVLFVDADSYTPSDATYMTTGEIAPVEGTPMDFRTPHPISATIIDTTFEQIRNASGYDHNWCLNTYADGRGDDSRVCATLYSPKTGIFLEVRTNEPGIQVYTGNFQGTGVACKHGVKYPKQVSVCLESQKYPDSPNKPEWPSPLLRPGEKYYSHVAYTFSVK